MQPLPSANTGRILTDPDQTAPFLADWNKRFSGTARCVVQPESTEQVAALLRWCNEHKVPVVPQGGNTNMTGAATPDDSGAAVVLSLARMNRVRSVDPIGNTVVVDAGVVLETLQQVAQDAGRLFPLSLGAQGTCMIGGNLSTNAGGTGVLRYGNTRELCLGLEVVTPAGDVLDDLRGLRKDNTGYDLRDLYIGSEGTLGVITGATMKLYPLPVARVTAWAALVSPGHALRLLELAQQMLGPSLTAFELMSDYCVELVAKKFSDTPKVFAEPHPWYVLLESSDLESEAHAIERFEALMGAALEQDIVQDAAVAQSIAQSKQFWLIRERIALSQPKNIKHDISLPIARIGEFVEATGKAITERFGGTRMTVLGHIGDGNLHYNVEPPAGLSDAEFLKLEKEVHQFVYDAVDAARGSMSAEHGIGWAKVGDLERYKSGVALGLMRTIKQALDPRGIMNPGKVLR
ncbi:MAG: FAD-binding oxidoreductase [Burkholderiales bacterium]